ncbi:MAG: hypothetical protein FGM37_01625 [Phycisphaerales bacterium]|nr:hypothetical protein [Phycisphaerales bacterium]
MIHPLLVAAATALAQASAPSGQAVPQGTEAAQAAAQPAQQAAPPEAQQIPWPITLGLRVIQVPLRVPVLNRVVIVPDEATYLDEISRWSLAGRWPVLIEDNFFAPMFVRAFKPESVVRRAAAAPMPADRAAQQAAAAQAISNAWRAPQGVPPGSGPVPGSSMVAPTEPSTLAPLQAFKAVGFEPCGMVFTSMGDPAWTAAVALAAAHGQPIGWIDQDLGAPWSSMPAASVVELSDTIERAVAATGLSWQARGDAIDAVTLCRTASGRAIVPPGARFRLPDGANVKPDEAVSLTDALCRNADGSRWGVAGWIFGDSRRSAYMAMSALFLDRTSALCFNSYQPDGQWGRYGMTEAVEMLKQAGLEVTLIDGPQATGVAWINLAMGGISPDVLLVNTSGNADFFDLWGQARMRPEQVPIANRPVAMQFIHSWSLGTPEVVDTVGGRWLDHGVYAYVGSVWEPFLSAFVPPILFTDRFVNLVPFGWCARWTEGPMDALWRVTVIGDPLMTTLGPARQRPARSSPAQPDASRGEIEMRDAARDALVAAKASGAAADYARAMRALVLAGDDAMAVQVWAVALGKGAGAECASDAMGPLFRAKDADGVVAAMRAMPADRVTLRDRDMLWQLWTPTLPALRDAATLEWFATQVRERRPYVDLIPLRGAMERAGVKEKWVEAVTLWRARTRDDEVKTELGKLLQG